MRVKPLRLPYKQHSLYPLPRGGVAAEVFKVPQERLLPRQRSFVRCLVVHNLSTTQAAMRAGYSRKPRSAAVVGCRLIHNCRHVREAIRRLASEIHQVEYLDAEEALRALRLWHESAAVMPRREAAMLT
jgi:phage terminase small subunit